MRSSFALFLLALMLTGQASAGDREAIQSAIRRVELVRRTERVPGISVAVVRDGRLIWATGRGYANLKPRAAAGVETVYEIGSLGKQFAAVMAEQMAGEGKLDLDAPLESSIEQWLGS